jgi:RNA polymerase primary sigma factor
LDFDDPVEVYLAEVRKVPPLTAQEEIELPQHLRAHDSETELAGHRLAEANLGLVVAIAERHRHAGMHILDLIQKGNNGLLVAVQTFATSSAESFRDHAAACIEREIVDAIADPGAGD